MNKPPLDDLMEKVDSKYTLVVVSAKRARTLTEGQSELSNPKSSNPVSISLHEIVDGLVEWERTRTGIK